MSDVRAADPSEVDIVIGIGRRAVSHPAFHPPDGPPVQPMRRPPA
ncbi:hypothetical protein [Amycolatopsis sp. RTGN1]|nr:hypothetical protein [Amycolatopsis sp. RTGN1]